MPTNYSEDDSTNNNNNDTTWRRICIRGITSHYKRNNTKAEENRIEKLTNELTNRFSSFGQLRNLALVCYYNNNFIKLFMMDDDNDTNYY